VEVSGTVTGTFGGAAVTGTNFLEHNGNWLLGGRLQGAECQGPHASAAG
jgi:hypothetical protein